jgi:hypothetical protein
MRQPLTPGQLLVRGRALIHLRQPQYALKDVQEAYFRREETTLFPSAIDPMGDQMWVLLGEVYYLTGDPQTALNFLNQSSLVLKNDNHFRVLYKNCLEALNRI